MSMRQLTELEKQNEVFLKGKGVHFVKVQLTENILAHAIFDATQEINKFLREEGVHDFSQQANGQEAKQLVPTHLLTFKEVVEMKTSLYKASKRGDRRMWFGSEIFPYVEDDDIFVIMAYNNELYIANMSHLDLDYCYKTGYNNPIKSYLNSLYSPPKVTVEIKSDIIDSEQQSEVKDNINDNTYKEQTTFEEVIEKVSEQEEDGITTSKRVAEDIMSETQDNNNRVLCQGKVGWTMDVWKCVEQIPNDIFRLEEVYAFAEELQQKYPNNKTIKASIRQKLQILREKGYIEFVGGGKYRKLKLKSFSYYAERVVNLNQAIIRGEVIVAKPVLLLALIDGVDKDVFDNNHFYLNEWLEERYLSLMKEYTKYSQFETPASINNPFWHLASDGFWHLQLKEEPKEKVTPTKTWLKDNVLYASFDDDMWVLLQNREYRNKMRNVIIDLINSQKRK